MKTVATGASMAKSLWLAIGLAFALNGASASPTADLPDQPAAATAPPPVAIEADPGFLFPAEIGAFRRASAQSFGDSGQNLVVDYDLIGSSRMSVSFFLQEAPPAIGGTPAAIAAARTANCERDFKGRERQLMKIHPTAKLIGRTEAFLPSGASAADGIRAIYTMKARFRGQRIPLRSELVLFCYVAGGWQLAYRATGPADQDFQGDLAELVSSIGWPEQGAAPEPADIAIQVRGYDTGFVMAGFIVAGGPADLAAFEQKARERGLWLQRLKEKDGEKLVSMFIGQGRRSAAARDIYRDATGGAFGPLRIEVMIITADDLAAGTDPSKALLTVSSDYVELR
jgi:hypothetical protein